MRKALWKSPLPVGSIRFRIIVGVVILILGSAILLLISNLYAAGLIRRQVYDANSRTLSLHMQQIEDGFFSVDRYLVGLDATGVGLAGLERPKRDIESYIAEHRMATQITQAAYSYRYIDAIFVFSSTHQVLLTGAGYDVEQHELTGMQAYLHKQLSKQENFTKQAKNKWIIVHIENQFYFLRVLKHGKTYVGAWVNVNQLLQPLKNMAYDGMDRILFVQNDGTPLSADPALQNMRIPLLATGDASHNDIKIGDIRHIVIYAPSQAGDFSLVTTIPSNYVLEGLKSIQILILILVSVMLVLIPLLAIALRSGIIRPLDDLIGAMQSLTSGNIEARIGERKVPDEFKTVYSAFDTMTTQIKALKISIYEEKLTRKRAELHYLQLQTNPHMLINCLNMIYSLAEIQKCNVIQEMASLLSSHLRFSLAGEFLTTLRNELNHVKNYIRIQCLRFPNSLACDLQYSEDLLEVPVPPLLLQTFVENTVKYQVVAGEFIEISIVLEKLERNRLRVTITDTGDGFAPHVLLTLNKGKRFRDERGDHIGIYNICQRLKILYTGQESVLFQNAPNAGAQIILEIPLKAP